MIIWTCWGSELTVSKEYTLPFREHTNTCRWIKINNRKGRRKKKETNAMIWDFNEFRWHEEIDNDMCTVWTDMSTLLMGREQNTRSIVILKISKLWNNRLLKNTDFTTVIYLGSKGGWYARSREYWTTDICLGEFETSNPLIQVDWQTYWGQCK